MQAHAACHDLATVGADVEELEPYLLVSEVATSSPSAATPAMRVSGTGRRCRQSAPPLKVSRLRVRNRSRRSRRELLPAVRVGIRPAAGQILRMHPPRLGRLPTLRPVRVRSRSGVRIGNATAGKRTSCQGRCDHQFHPHRSIFFRPAWFVKSKRHIATTIAGLTPRVASDCRSPSNRSRRRKRPGSVHRAH